MKVELKLSDSDETDDDDNAKLGNSKPVKLLGGSQVGTPLPNVELVKDLLQSGTALNSDANSQVPLIVNGQSLLQQSPTLVQPAAVQQPLQTQQLLQQEFAQQQHRQKQQQSLNNLLPQVASLTSPLNGNKKISSSLLKSASTNLPLLNQDKSTDSPLTVQPVALNPSLLSQAILGSAKFQPQQAGKSENTQGISLENGPELGSLPLGALSTLPVQYLDSTDQIASLQENAGMTSTLPAPSLPEASLPAASLPAASLPATSLPFAGVDASKATQFQSPIRLPDLQLPMQLGPPARKTNTFGFPPAGVANKKSPLEEYRYDLHDKEGN